jgi:hypothetical protein
MVETIFEIEGAAYKLKYQKTKTDEGELYQGIIFLKKAIGFSYIVRKDKTIFFDNTFIDKSFRDIIIRVIDQKERS